jgi:CelD/BcsL family acetyltransferase involved in cellulose biosynthesis
MAVARARNDIEVAILEENGQPIGFFPYQRVAPLVAQSVGAPLNDYQGVITSPEQRFDPLVLLKGAHLSRLDFDHLIAAQMPFVPFHKSLATSPYLDLSRGFNAYAASRPRGSRTPFDRLSTLEHRLAREVGPIRFEAQVADMALLEQTMRWKSAQYLRSGQTAADDLFADPRMRAILHEIHAVQRNHFAGMLSVLWAGDTLVAVHFGMRSRQVWHYWFPAYDVAFAQYSPGLLLLWHMTQVCESLGIRTLDLGKVNTLYKDRFMSATFPLAEGSVVLPDVRGSWGEHENTIDTNSPEDFASSYLALELEDGSLRRRLVALEREVRRLESVVDSVRPCLAEQDNSERSLFVRQELEEARAESNHLLATLQAAEKEVQSIIASKSWRVTAPLRGLYDHLLSLQRRCVEIMGSRRTARPHHKV